MWRAHTQGYDDALRVAEVYLMALCSAEDAGLGSHTYLGNVTFMATTMQVAALMATVSGIHSSLVLTAQVRPRCQLKNSVGKSSEMRQLQPVAI
jgi:hypothetical protein